MKLDGSWTLRYFNEHDKLPASPAEARLDNAVKIPATVPGNVELDLSRAGILPEDLYYGANILQLRPYENYQWWYEREFITPDWHGCSGTELVFEGLDCFATVWVNDREIGRSANAMVAQRFDLSDSLNPTGTTNTLTVRLASPINEVRNLPLEPVGSATLFHGESMWARKPAHCYEWDIMPRAVSAGIWRPVYLAEKRATEITSLYVETIRQTEALASLTVTVGFRSDLPLHDFSLRLRGVCGDSVFEAEEILPFSTVSFNVEVPQPKRWFPRGYGDPNLYDVEAELLHQGKTMATRRFKLGIRTVILDRTDVHTPENPGRFSFIVNDVPVFCRGSNWVPADAFHSRDAERIPAILPMFADMECNIIRCWGGNVYEPHSFYDFCDREGIMVWQDFSMACAIYPQNSAFLEIIRAEAEQVIQKLRQHPSIALWSGDNECDEVPFWTGRRTDPATNRITREVLPEVVRRLDPMRPFLPSSPYLSAKAFELRPDNPEAVVPEQHLWGPRGYYKSDFYAKNTAIFASEIGYHGCPGISSIARFISPESRWTSLDNLEWTVHSAESIPGYPKRNRNMLMYNQIRELFGVVPEQLEDFAVASQIVQAEAKKFFVELFRQKKGQTGGIIWWNMMDGWPQFSDAIVDYYFNKKLAYHYLKRIHAPLAIILGEPSDGIMPVIAVNDSLTARSGRFTIRDADSGETVADGKFTVDANGRAITTALPCPGERQSLFLIEWIETHGQHGVSHYLYGKPPFDLAHYRHRWLPQIAALDQSFDADQVGR